LRSEIERIRQRELMRSLRLHPDLPPDTLDTITRSLINKIFHGPTQRLRQAADPELADALAALFRRSSQGEPYDGA
jgi:glutamyl-tRNA reductase